jgi:replicative DNA helicase
VHWWPVKSPVTATPTGAGVICWAGWSRWLQAQRLRSQSHILHLGDTPGLSIQQLRAKCTRLHAQYLLRLVLVDYVQLRRGDTKGKREQEVGSISRGLKELDAPVIALAQLSRDVEKRPTTTKTSQPGLTTTYEESEP